MYKYLSNKRRITISQRGVHHPHRSKGLPHPCARGRDPGYLLLLFLCLAGVLGSWIGSFKAPFRWMILSWITSRMFLIHSCLVSMLEACSATGRDSKNLISLQSTATVLNPSLAGLIHHWSRIPNVGGVYFSGFFFFLIFLLLLLLFFLLYNNVLVLPYINMNQH